MGYPSLCHALKGLPFDVIMELVPPAVPPLKLAVADATFAPKTAVGGLGVVPVPILQYAIVKPQIGVGGAGALLTVRVSVA